MQNKLISAFRSNSSLVLLYFVRNSRIVDDEFGTAGADSFIFDLAGDKTIG